MELPSFHLCQRVLASWFCLSVLKLTYSLSLFLLLVYFPFCLLFIVHLLAYCCQPHHWRACGYLKMPCSFWYWAGLEYHWTSLNMAKFFSFLKSQWQCWHLQNPSPTALPMAPQLRLGPSFLCAYLLVFVFSLSFPPICLPTSTVHVEFFKRQSICDLPQYPSIWSSIWYAADILCTWDTWKMDECQKNYLHERIIQSYLWIALNWKNKIDPSIHFHVAIAHLRSSKEHSQCKEHHTVHVLGWRTVDFRHIIVFGHTGWEKNIN